MKIMNGYCRCGCMTDARMRINTGNGSHVATRIARCATVTFTQALE